MTTKTARCRKFPALSREAWRAIGLRTIRHTAISILASAIVCSAILEIFSEGIGTVGLVVSIVAPLVLGGPMVLVMSMRQRQLHDAYDRLEAAARRDSLTGCLHHGAFVEEVTACLADAQAGTLLIIDADHFKAVNDTFGHGVGDTALTLIATAITANAGPAALVGRLGGEEFGLFLAGADRERGRAAGNAIRAAVEALSIEVGRKSCRLSVSIGGASVQHADRGFDVLFREADAHLYKVKDMGRNNVSIAAPGEPEPVRAGIAPSPITDLAPNRPRRAIA